MTDIIEYVQSPQYNNFFKEFDKKLTKNILKRCVVEPFNERIMKKCLRSKSENEQVLMTEIELYEREDAVIGAMNNMLKELFKIDKFITDSLKELMS